MRSGWWRPDWQPAALVAHDIALVKLLLGAGAIARAEDYAHGGSDQFGILEAALPLWWWSAACFTVGVLILAGMAARQHFVVWLGHAFGTGLYTLLWVAALGAAFDGWPNGEITAIVADRWWAAMCLTAGVVFAVAWVTNRGGPNCNIARVSAGLGIFAVVLAATLARVPIDGLRAVGPLIIIAVLHGLFAVRSGPRPLGANTARVVEATAAPDGS